MHQKYTEEKLSAARNKKPIKKQLIKRNICEKWTRSVIRGKHHQFWMDYQATKWTLSQSFTRELLNHNYERDPTHGLCQGRIILWNPAMTPITTHNRATSNQVRLTEIPRVYVCRHALCNLGSIIHKKSPSLLEQ